MKRDPLDVALMSQSALLRLRALAVGVTLATIGVVSSSPASEVSERPDRSSLMPTIVDRSRKGTKLVLRSPGHSGNSTGQGRVFHCDHASHYSHYSSLSGDKAAPRLPSPRQIPRDSQESQTSGTFTDLDVTHRTLTLTDATGKAFTFSWNAATTLKDGTEGRFIFPGDGRNLTIIGCAQEAERNIYGHLQRGTPIVIHWKPSADGKTRVAVSITQ